MKLRRLVAIAKRFLKLPNVFKRKESKKESITFQKRASRDVWRIFYSVLNKSKSGIAPPFNSSEKFPFTSVKAKLFTENISEKTLVYLYLLVIAELI